jgi:hypothetical protein
MRRIAPLLALLLLLVPGIGRADGTRSGPWQNASTERATKADGLGFSTVDAAATASTSGSIHLAVSAARTSPVGFSVLTDEASALGTIHLGLIASSTGQVAMRVHLSGSASASTSVQSLGTGSVSLSSTLLECTFDRGCFFAIQQGEMLGTHSGPLPDMAGGAFTGPVDVDLTLGGAFLGCTPMEFDVQFGIEARATASGAATSSGIAELTVESISWTDVPCGT